MKQTIKTGFTALLLLLAISCKKENSRVQTSSINGSSSTQNGITDDQVAAGRTVKIGTQVWISKNLDVSHYRNGDRIPQVTGPIRWKKLTTGAWCWYNNDSATYAATYGKLYNWYAVNDPRGLAPTGWHVPSDAEWTTLSTFLGGDAVAGGKMKETGTTHWVSPNFGATNSSGFTGLPGGIRDEGGIFYYIGLNGIWWSSTEDITTYARGRSLGFGNRFVSRYVADKRNGFSVRCLRD